jgi:8-oxo-dGTP diphosphatase
MKPGIDYIGVAVGIFILNDKGEVFLTKRSAKTTNERGTWEIPGGKVHFGETLQAAAKREAKEEYGITVQLLEQFPAQNHLIPAEHQHWVPTCFLCKITGKKKPVIMEPEKCDAIGWFSLDNLPKPLSIITKIDIGEYQKTHH